MIIDTNKIQVLLDDKSISYDHIAEVTGLSKGAIYPYRAGKRDITAMSIEVAHKLQSFYENNLKEEKQVNLKIKGIKKAVSEFNKWEEQARVYFDKEEMEVWTNVYPSGNEAWDEYHDDNIVSLTHKRGVVARDNDYLSMRELQELCLTALNQE